MLRSITLCTRCSPKKKKGKRTKNNESQIHGMLEAAITDGNKGLRTPTLVLDMTQQRDLNQSGHQ